MLVAMKKAEGEVAHPHPNGGDDGRPTPSDAQPGQIGPHAGSDARPKRRRLATRAALQPPAGAEPGVWWATRSDPNETSPIDALMHQLDVFQRQEPPVREVSIELRDDGEPSPFGGAGDLPEFRVEPWSAVVWVGPPTDAEAAILRVLDQPEVGRALCEGATLILDRRDSQSLSTQRADARSIHGRLRRPPPGPATPLPDRAIDSATRAAHQAEDVPSPVTSKPMPLPADVSSTGPTPETWQPDDDGWHPRPGEFWYRRRQHDLSGKEWALLKVFVDARRPLTEEDLRQLAWPGDDPEKSTISSTLTSLRKQLREKLPLPNDFNPLPAVDRTPRLAWRLDREGIEKLTSGASQRTPE
ncbi:MAG: helix-turn-helix domain-containing protein [Chloroflexota bacterium]|nr:helix-turn-helix domain-containing protein [Chloroflexota bacterium]